MSTLADQCRRRRYSMATNEDYINRCMRAEGKAHFERRTIAQCCAILTVWTLHIVQYSVKRQNQSAHVRGSLILSVSVSCRGNDHWWIDLVVCKAAYKYNLIASSSYAYSREVRCALCSFRDRYALGDEHASVCWITTLSIRVKEWERAKEEKRARRATERLQMLIGQDRDNVSAPWSITDRGDVHPWYLIDSILSCAFIPDERLEPRFLSAWISTRGDGWPRKINGKVSPFSTNNRWPLAKWHHRVPCFSRWSWKHDMVLPLHQETEVSFLFVAALSIVAAGMAAVPIREALVDILEQHTSVAFHTAHQIGLCLHPRRRMQQHESCATW
jgi:hypothetical protein